MKVFLDVGAHRGESLRAVLPRYLGFDRIYCFEPSAQRLSDLERLADARVRVLPFGLSEVSGDRPLYDPGSVGASVIGERTRSGNVQSARFERASDWFRNNLRDEDDVFMKLNVEGAECDILDDLIETGELRKVRSALVSFDVRKFTSTRDRDKETLARLEAAGAGHVVVDADAVRGITRAHTIQQWLHASGAEPRQLDPRALLSKTSQQLRWIAIPRLLRILRVGSLARRLLPRHLVARLGGRFLGQPGEPPRPRNKS